MSLCRSSKRGRLLASFGAWDKTGEGFISKDTLVDLFVGLGVPPSSATKIIDSAKLEFNGMVDYREFVDWFMGPPPMIPELPPLPISIVRVQTAWRAGLLNIGKVMRDGGDAIAEAEKFVDAQYALNDGRILFKPSADDDAGANFGSIRENAMKYYLNPLLQFVSDVSLDNLFIVKRSTQTFAQGCCTFVLATGQSQKRDYTFGYEPDIHGDVKIFLHSSAGTPKVQGELISAGADMGEFVEIVRAQKTWANGLLNVSSIARSGGDYMAAAETFVDGAYSYRNGQVLFKVTSNNGGVFFAETRDSVVKYFGSPTLQVMASIRFENRCCIRRGEHFFATGIYYFGCGGVEVAGDYTLGYERNDQGDLHIFLHQSSMPFL